MSAIIGPIAPENNPPITPQFYNPSRFVISNIALGQTTTVTTLLDNDYVIGQQVRLIIPPSFGCRQLNESSSFVIQILSPTQVVLDLNSAQNVDPFVASSATTKAQILPIGDINSGIVNSTGRKNNIIFIPGSFINVSPQ